MNNAKALRPLLIFIIVAISCGWLGVWIDTIIPSPNATETLGMGIWLVLPLITALFLSIFSGNGWRDIGIFFRVTRNIKWYLVAIFIFPVVTGTVLLLGKLLGWVHTDNFSIGKFLPIFALLLIPNFIKNIFEESVWRGYLTTKVAHLTKKDSHLYLIVGLVWGIWHLPYYLVFLQQHEMSMFLPVGRIGFAIVAIICMVGWTVMFVELFLITKSIWPVVLMHMMEDSLVNPLITERFITITAGKEWFVSPVFGLITNILYLLIGLWLRTQRKVVSLHAY
jgi:hypothetical protein